MSEFCRMEKLSAGRRARATTRRSTGAVALVAAAATVSGLLGLGLGAVAGAAPAPPANGHAPAVRVLGPSSVPPEALTGAYTRARVRVAGVRPGSERVAVVTATGVEWAIATFRAPAGTTGDALQDGAATGIFRRDPGQGWALVAPGVEPLSCDPALPAALRAAWRLEPAARCNGTSPAAAAVAARRIQAKPLAGAPTALGATIATLALGQVGESDQPAVDSFDTVDCDPYTTMVGPAYADPDNRGCGYDSTFGVEDDDEEWCADFADWVWLRAGVTEGTDLITPAASSFYDWGKAEGEPLKVDASDPQVGDAVVFYPAGAVTASTAADHVGIVSSVNADGTVDLVNGDFLGTSDIGVQYDTDVDLSTWAAQIWGPGEQWVFVSPPTSPQPAAPSVAISGPHVVAAGAAARFAASASVAGGSVTSYAWAFGDGGYVPDASAQGPAAAHVFAEPGQYTVSLVATSSLGTVSVKTWDVDVIAGSSTATSTPSGASYTGYAPVAERVFTRTSSGGLAEESWDGASWLDESLPGALGAGAVPAVLDYEDAGDVLTQHVFYRTPAGPLAETYQQGGSWATATLPGSAATGSPVAAAVMGSSGATTYPAVFTTNSSGQIVESSDPSGTWVATTLGPAGVATRALAVGTTAAGGTATVDVYSVDANGALVVTSPQGNRWSSAIVTSSLGVAPGSSLAAVAAGAGGQPAVFFVDKADRLAEATSPVGGAGWTVTQVASSAVVPGAALEAIEGFPAGGEPAPEVVAETPMHQALLATHTASGWTVETLPGTATAILGLAGYPVPGASQVAVFEDAKAVEADTTGTGAAPWATTRLPAAPVTAAGRVLLYAATTANEATATAAAKEAGLPASQATGSFSKAWAGTLSGDYLVIAVGAAATDALDYNVCGWPNPSGASGGATPFDRVTPPIDALPGAGYFEEAAGSTAARTASLADDLAYDAVHGRLPAGVTSLPPEARVAYTCTGTADA